MRSLRFGRVLLLTAMTAMAAATAACGSSLGVAPTTSNGPTTTTAPQVHVTADHHHQQSRRAAAARDAAHLLSLLRLPPGASRLNPRMPKGTPRELRVAETMPGTPFLVDRWGYSVVPGTPDEVLSFVEAHAPAGSVKTGSGAAGGPGYLISFDTFSYPAVSFLDERAIQVAVIAFRPGETLLRADAQDVYTPARPPAEHIPSGVTRVEITATGPDGHVFRATVTQPGEIAKLRKAVDGLTRPDYTVNPGGPMITLPMMREEAVLRFFVGDGVRAAVVVVDHPVLVIMGVGNITFRVGGRSEPVLEDYSWVVANLVEQQTGVHFVHR